MFLNLLNPNQQSLFFELARAVTEQDGIIAETEELLLAAIHAECSLVDIPPVRELETVLRDTAEAFDSGPTRSALVLELAGVALIDGDAHPAETAVLASVSERIGVSADRLAQCFEFAERARALVVDGQTLIATADGED